jgi:Domain of unknown function (DUF4336)
MRAIADGVWEANTPIRFGFIPLRHRMTVIRLRDGRLVLHSPSKLTGDTQRELSGLGDIAAIVAPSWWHDLWLRDWKSAYPGVPVYAAPALVQSSKIEMIALDSAPAPWADELEHIHVHGLGLWLDEYAFYHPASRSLMVADLLLSAGEDDPRLTQTFSRIVVGRLPGARFPRLYRPAVLHRSALRESIQRIAMWDFDRIIVGHGDNVETNGKKAFLEAFRWLGLTGSF